MILYIQQILFPAVALGVIGAIAAALLCIVVRRFAVKEDERVEQVEALLPGANCGACGFLGCHDFALQCVRLGGPEGISCPGAGPDGMAAIAALFGMTGGTAAKNVAVLRCNGTCASRHPLSIYSGPQGCNMESMIVSGPLTCAFGCIQCGDCVKACPFEAMKMDPVTNLPEIDENKCTGCGICAGTCPRNLLTIQPSGPKGRRVWVACSNRHRGTIARKECDSACIGCGKCERVCPFGAVSITDNVATIDPALCRLCRKCVAVCPTGAIHTANFPSAQTIKPEAS